MDHRSLYRYNPAMKAYFSQYKFQGDYLLRKVFAQELAEMIQKNYRGFTPVPVPVSKERYQERGFNQVTAILDAGNISYVNLFKRLDTDRQSSKNKKERLLSERHYQLIVNEEIPEKIVIVDDIYTTGSTIITLKKALEKVGNTVIKSLSIAR
ncbi:ComF family protein [Streptococcus castoreus]|uniref:ComF family protein n=1 Tax=Streptococcus castoreus TaxID=254786 RepID=UPI001FC86A83|nr:ComF family protein [Streptococcus castoreus]